MSLVFTAEFLPAYLPVLNNHLFKAIYIYSHMLRPTSAVMAQPQCGFITVTASLITSTSGWDHLWAQRQIQHYFQARLNQAFPALLTIVLVQVQDEAPYQQITWHFKTTIIDGHSHPLAVTSVANLRCNSLLCWACFVHKLLHNCNQPNKRQLVEATTTFQIIISKLWLKSPPPSPLFSDEHRFKTA